MRSAHETMRREVLKKERRDETRPRSEEEEKEKGEQHEESSTNKEKWKVKTQVPPKMTR